MVDGEQEKKWNSAPHSLFAPEAPFLGGTTLEDRKKEGEDSVLKGGWCFSVLSRRQTFRIDIDNFSGGKHF